MTDEKDKKDACQVCHGDRDGVPGNENLVNGVVMCDYCHADTLRFGKPRAINLDIRV